MGKNDIHSKCRKVWIVTTQGRIFGDEPADRHSEPRYVPPFQTQEIADGNVTDRLDSRTKAYNCDRFGRPLHPPEKLKAVAVYLVPASKIDS